MEKCIKKNYGNNWIYRPDGFHQLKETPVPLYKEETYTKGKVVITMAASWPFVSFINKTFDDLFFFIKLL